MGERTETYRCPHCDGTMGESNGPNWTRAPDVTIQTGAVLVMSCPHCRKVLGTVLAQSQTSGDPRTPYEQSNDL